MVTGEIRSPIHSFDDMQRRGKDSAAFTSAVTAAATAVIIIFSVCVCVKARGLGLLREWWLNFGRQSGRLCVIYVHKPKPVFLFFF